MAKYDAGMTKVRRMYDMALDPCATSSYFRRTPREHRHTFVALFEKFVIPASYLRRTFDIYLCNFVILARHTPLSLRRTSPYFVIATCAIIMSRMGFCDNCQSTLETLGWLTDPADFNSDYGKL